MKKMIILAMAIALTLSFVSLSFAKKTTEEFPTVGDEGKVTFSHEIHTEGKNNFPCKECHPVLFQMKKGADVPKMADMAAGKNCGACHNGTRAFSVTDKEKCGNCHKK